VFAHSPGRETIKVLDLKIVKPLAKLFTGDDQKKSQRKSLIALPKTTMM
jgi:hypothetical protein